jgi:hypothetical protein
MIKKIIIIMVFLISFTTPVYGRQVFDPAFITAESNYSAATSQEKLVDNVMTTNWRSVGVGTQSIYISLNDGTIFPHAKITHLRLWPFTTTTTAPRSFEFFGSKDNGTTWESLGSWSNQTSWTHDQYEEYAIKADYYDRWKLTLYSSGTTYYALDELDCWSTTDPNEQIYVYEYVYQNVYETVYEKVYETVYQNVTDYVYTGVYASDLWRLDSVYGWVYKEGSETLEPEVALNLVYPNIINIALMLFGIYPAFLVIRKLMVFSQTAFETRMLRRMEGDGLPGLLDEKSSFKKIVIKRSIFDRFLN